MNHFIPFFLSFVFSLQLCANKPNNEYIIVIEDDGCLSGYQLSDKGKDDYDIIHIQKGKTVLEIGYVAKTIKVDNIGGHRRLAPGVFEHNFVIPPPASGFVQTIDSPLEWIFDLPKVTLTATGKAMM